MACISPNAGEPMSSEYPFKSTTESAKIEDFNTNVAITLFDNLVYVIISQFGKMGNVVQIHVDLVRKTPVKVYESRILLGKDEPEIHASAKVLAERLQTSKPLIIGLALKHYKPELVRKVIDFVEKVYNNIKADD